MESSSTSSAAVRNDDGKQQQEQQLTNASSILTLPHRRVELQSPLDLSYLLNNARSAARAKIDLHLPLQTALQTQPTHDSSSLGYGDEMRKAVESSVDKYLDQTFEMVRLGVTVNGIDGEKADWGIGLAGPEEYEPYDHELATRITTLHATIERLNLELATIRRETVRKAARDYEERFIAASQKVDAALDQFDQHAVESASQAEEVRLGFEGRGDEVKRIWRGAVEGLGGLEKGLQETRQSAERTARVVEYLEGG